MTNQEFAPIEIALSASDREAIGKRTTKVAPSFGSCLSFNVDTFANLGDTVQILQRRTRRFRAHIFIQQLQQANGTAANSTPNPTTSPAANSNVSTPLLLTPGTYTLAWTCELSGTLGAVDADNFRLTFGSTNIAAGTNLAVAGEYPQPNYAPFVMPSGSTQTLKVRNAAAGTVGSVYSGTIEAQPITAGGGIIVLNSKKEPLLLPIPEGLYIQTPQVIPWESQRPCYATLIGTGPITVSVKDESYDETE